jgi:hypothetical protein
LLRLGLRPEPEEELRPGTAMVSSSPDAAGEVAPISLANAIAQRSEKREMKGKMGASRDKRRLERSREAWGGVI